MKSFYSILVFLFVFAFNSKATNKVLLPPGGNNDTTSNIKSNIVIFKMITSPQTSSNPVSGTLKKAGKVARTSTTTTTHRKATDNNEG